jgi:hypothetical protein
MGEARVKEAIAAPAEKVWGLIEDFGNTSWMPGGGGSVEVVGSGPGMARIISAGDQKIREVLESADASSQTLVYTIPEGVPFPVTGYRSTIRVTGDASNSELEWGCSFEPDGVDEAQVTAMIEGMYSTMVGWVRDSITS